MNKFLALFIGILVFVLAIFFNGLSQFELPETGQHAIRFVHAEDMLQGTLLLPEGVANPPVVVIVHGDGAQDRWSNGGYIPLVNFFISRGIGVFSWDKPGVGKSSGNWLAQNMSDRASETVAALDTLRALPDLEKSRVGLLGFSQAGWVVPQASQMAEVDFVILIGSAINWREQGMYYMRQRLKGEGLTEGEISRAVARKFAAFDIEFTAEAVARPCDTACSRKDFERRNALADARDDIAAMRVPLMILMGESDLNVDPRETISLSHQLLPDGVPRCLKLVKGATHGLLRVRWFNYQLAEQWPWWTEWLFLASGKSAYAPEAIDYMSDWILHQKC